MVAVAHESHNRHSHHPAHLAEGLRKHCRGTHKRISGFRIDTEHIALIYHLLGLADEVHIIGKLPLSYAAYTLHKPFQARETHKCVDSDNIVGILRKYGLGDSLEIEEGVVAKAGATPLAFCHKVT